MENVLGLHHVTAITSSAEKIYEFFTYVLGMRLVKKTVNQDDIQTYHLFFADDMGSAGTDMTFFDFNGINKTIRGANEIHRTAFRVPTDEALNYWVKRFKHYNVKHSNIIEIFGKKAIQFEDFDEQKYMLISDEFNIGVKSGTPWLKGPVPNEYAITGLGPIWLVASDTNYMHDILTKVLEFRNTKNEGLLSLYEMGEGGNGASIIVEKSQSLKQSVQGYGAVHHVAFRVKDKNTLLKLADYFSNFGFMHSGYVERFYFGSLYIRLYPYMLFEFATDGPGFIDDEETYENLGETLALPPKFRNQRAYVESVVRHINTVRSNIEFKKEYFD